MIASGLFKDCPACYNLDVFFGLPIESGGVPTYTIYREYNDELNTLDVSYFTFYPYNRGKDACVGIDPIQIFKDQLQL